MFVWRIILVLKNGMQALQKLAMEHPQACMRHGALLAVLSYLDFFQTGVQRLAVATAAHMCRGLSSDSHEAIAGAVPLLTNLLHHQACLVLILVAIYQRCGPACKRILQV